MRSKKWKLTKFGLQVHEELLKRNWTVEKLAKNINANSSYIRGLLYGQRSSKKHIASIKEILNIE